MSDNTMQSYQSISAGRAIATTMVRRYILKIIIIILLALTALLILFLYLTFSQSLSWLAGVILIVPLIIIGGVIGFFVHMVSQKMSPRKLSKAERNKIIAFVDEFSLKYMATLSVKRTPIGLASYIMWRYIRSGDSSIKQTIISPVQDINHLKMRFKEIAKMF